MKYLILPFLILILFASCVAKRTMFIPDKHRVEVQYFLKTKNFVKNNPSPLRYTAYKKKKHDYVEIYDIYNPADDSIDKNVNNPWAIKIDNQMYYNMRFAEGKTRNELFAKFDYSGKINLLVVDSETSKQIRGVGVTTNEANISHSGISLSYSNIKQGRIVFKDEDGDEYELIVLNSDPRYYQDTLSNAVAKAIGTKNFNKVLGTNYTEDEIDKFTIEDIIRIVKELNKK